MQETRVQSLDREDPLEKEMATHSSIPALEIPWAEEPVRLQSMGSQKVRHHWGTITFFLSSSLSHFTASITSEENNFLWSLIAMSICVIMVTLTFNIIRCFTFNRDWVVIFKLRRRFFPLVVKLGGCEPAAAAGQNPSHVQGAGSRWGKRTRHRKMQEWEEERGIYTFLVALDSCFQPLTGGSALTSGFLTPGFSALILQVAPIAF